MGYERQIVRVCIKEKRFLVLVISKEGACHSAPLNTILFGTCANAVLVLKAYVGNATIADNVV